MQTGSINVLENRKVLLRLNMATFPLLIVFFSIFYKIAKITKPHWDKDFGVVEALWLLLVLLGLVVLHELVHGIFFKLFYPAGKVKIGFKGGLAYATSPHSFYKKDQFIIILLAPFVSVTLLLAILYFSKIISAEFFVFLGTFHSAACVGDFFLTCAVSKQSKGTMVEDTAEGINFYMEKVE